MDADALWKVGERYRLVRQLGEGGMASVWVATDLESGVDVAIKFLAPAFAASPKFRARFAQEAFALQELSSPNIVKVYAHGEDEHRRPYIVMELLDGEDLQARLAREKLLSFTEVAALLAEVAKALQHAHAKGIVHRDLKPANVFFARSDGEEHIKLLDFGIAKIKRSDSTAEATRTGMIFGTFNYMSPEQMRGSKDVDSRSDVWSLGVIAFRTVTGELPFPGQEYPELFPKICHDPIPAASAVAPALTISAEMDAFFARALDRDPQRRFQTALELAEEFERVTHSRPPVERPVTAVLSVGTAVPVPAAVVREPAPSEPASTAQAALEPESPAPGSSVSEHREPEYPNSEPPGREGLKPVTDAAALEEQGGPEVAEEGDGAVKHNERNSGGLTVPPSAMAEGAQGTALATSRFRTVAALVAGVVGVLCAWLLLSRARSSPAISAPDEPVLSTTATSGLVSALPTSAPTPTSDTDHPSSPRPPFPAEEPAQSATVGAPPLAPPAPTAPMPSPNTVAATTPTTVPGPRPTNTGTAPKPVNRVKDSYCELTNPHKPYASPKRRTGCVKTLNTYCCP